MSEAAADRGADVDVGEFVDGCPIGPLHWVIVGLGGFITIIDGFDLVAMGMVVPNLSADWSLDPSAFSVALSAALVGVLFGSAAAGSMGDAIGRRWTLILMSVICAAFMGLTAIVTSMNELILYRFLTGFGAGGSIPVAIALTSEYMPARYRNTLVTLMYAGASVGSVVGGLAGPSLLETYDWLGVFVLGGVLSAVAAVLLLLFLPESLRFLVNQGDAGAKVRRIAERLHPGALASHARFIIRESTLEAQAPSDHAPEQAPRPTLAERFRHAAFRELFGGRQTQITLVVWLVFIATQFQIFFIGLWLPTVFVEGGLALAAALTTMAIYGAGGAVGGPAFGWISDRLSPQKVLRVTYPAAALLIASLGFVMHQAVLLPLIAFLTGAAAIGSSLCLGALTAQLYPTRARATGVGWALSVGRAGSILAPLIGGVAFGWGAQGFFLSAAAAPLVAAFSIMALSAMLRSDQPSGTA